MRFLLHYNFPPFSTGEAKAQRGVGRREIGHGHLAWRALKGQIPADFPYTVRVVSDILESNGSSSMATVCAGTLALMDAGVPSSSVSGIAMGLIKNPGEEKYAVLSDILGDEDHLGDMDFKTTGTAKGLTATQMDIKCDGLSYEILEKALAQAKQLANTSSARFLKPWMPPAPNSNRTFLASKPSKFPKNSSEQLLAPAARYSGHAGRNRSYHHHRRRRRCGQNPGFGSQQGKHRRSHRTDSRHRCHSRSRRSLRCKVMSIMPYGCFVEFMPGKEGLLHISEISWKRLETVEEAGLKEGDHIQVKLLEIDEKTGKFRLSHRVLEEKPEGWEERPARRPRREGGEGRAPRRPRQE